MNPRVFISYSHDNDDFRDWVRAFADLLIRDGIDVTLDQYDLALGDMLPRFMEEGISQNDFVLVLVTEGFIEKAKTRKGGVGFETDLSSGELMVAGNRRKFIPIAIKVEFKHMPTYLQGANGIKIDNLFDYEKQYQELYRNLTGTRIRKPSLGSAGKSHVTDSRIFPFDTDSLLNQTKKRLDKYFVWDFLFDSRGLADKTLSQLFEYYKKLTITKTVLGSERTYPWIFSSTNRRSNYPELIYESDDYSSNISNIAFFDRLVLSDVTVRYSQIFMTEGDPFLVYSRLAMATVAVALRMLEKIHDELKRSVEVNALITLTTSKQAVYFEKQALWPIRGEFMDNYILPEGSYEIEHQFNSLGIDAKEEMIGKILGLFISQNSSTDYPFLTVKRSEFRRIYGRLLNDSSFF